MKKYLAMLLAVVMVFRSGRKRLCSGHRRHLQRHLHRLQSEVQVSTTVEGLTLSGSNRSATLRSHGSQMPQGFSLIFNNADGTNFDRKFRHGHYHQLRSFRLQHRGRAEREIRLRRCAALRRRDGHHNHARRRCRSVHDRCSQTDRTGCGSGSRGVSARGWSVHERRRERLRLGDRSPQRAATSSRVWLRAM